jgi:hypothetical protein
MTLKNCSLLILGVACGLLTAFVLSFMGMRESSYFLIGAAFFLLLGLICHRMTK